MRKSNLLARRIAGAALSFVVAFTGVPMESFAAENAADDSIEIAEEVQEETSSDEIEKTEDQGQAESKEQNIGSVKKSFYVENVTEYPEFECFSYEVLEDEEAVRIIKFNQDKFKVDEELWNEYDGWYPIIPDEIEGYPVKYIGPGAFEGAFRGASSGSEIGMIAIKISKNVEVIEKGAFFEISVLKAIEFQEGSALTTIEDDAFGETSFEDVYLPSTLKSIGERAFENSQLTEICIPASVESIGEFAFSGSMLEEVSFSGESKLTSIADGVFEASRQLAYIEIPNTVKTIGARAFAGCHGGLHVSLPENYWVNGDYKPLSIGEEAFSNSEIVDIYIPKYVSMGNNVFLGSEIHNITFAGNVPYRACYGAASLGYAKLESASCHIGDEAFSGCDCAIIDFHVYDEKYDSGESVYIGDAAFAHCYYLEIEFPENLIYIGAGAFADCWRMEIEKLPDSVEYIGDGAFWTDSFVDKELGLEITYAIEKMPANLIYIGDNAIGKRKFTDATLPEGLRHVGAYAFGNTDFGEVKITKLLTEEESYIDTYWDLFGNENIGDGAFWTAEKIVIEDGVTHIPDYTCSEAEDLVEVVIPDTVTQVGKYAFLNCSSLKTIDLPENVTSLGDKAFSGCLGLTDFTIPETVTTIGSGAFEDCVALTAIDIPYGIKEINSRTFAGCTGFSELIIPDTVASIGSEAFEGCLTLTSINIPYGIKTIEKSTFAMCEALSGISIPDCVESIGDQAFSGCKSLKSINLPGGITVISNGTFENCSSLASVRLPSGLNKVGDQAFENCTSLSKISLPGEMRSVGKRAFFNTGISTATIPGKVYSLGEDAFGTTRKLIFSEGITEISGREFMNNSALEEIVLPGSLKTIDDKAFYECSSLTKINLPEGLTIIGIDAFYGCSSLSSVKLPSTLSEIGARAFSETGIESINVPASLKKINMRRRFGGGVYYETPFGSAQTVIFDSGITKALMYICYGSKNLEEVVFPRGFRQISSYAFGGCSSLWYVRYMGTEEEWSTVFIDNGNSAIEEAEVLCVADGQDTEELRDIKVNPSSLVVYPDEEVQLGVTFYPKNAMDKTVKWSSSAPDVVAVDEKTGKITAKKYGKAEITATSVGGKFKSTCKVTVSDGIPVLNDISFGFSGMSIKVDKGVPLLGGKEYEVNLPVTFGQEVVIEDNKIKVGWNIKRENLHSFNTLDGVTTKPYERKPISQQFEEFKREVKKGRLLSKHLDWINNVEAKKFAGFVPVFEDELQIHVLGYLEGEWNGEKKPTKIEGSLVIVFSASATAKGTYIIPAITVPVTINCGLSADGKLIGTAGYDFEKATPYGEIKLDFGVGLELYTGIGPGELLSIGPYGRGQCDINITLLSSTEKPGVKNVTVYGDAGLKYCIGGVSENVPIFTSKLWQIYPQNNKKTSDADYLELNEEALKEPGIVRVLEYAPGIQMSSADQEGTLVSNVYNAAKPIFAEAGSDSMLFYVTDDSSREALNSTVLVYSLYDSNTDIYSEPKAVLDDGTADFAQEVFTDGNDIYTAWLDSDTEYAKGDEPGLYDYEKTFKVHVAKYDSDKDSFESLGVPQECTGYSSCPKLFVNDGKLYLAFVESSVGTLGGLSSDNKIYWDSYDFSNKAWKVESQLSNLNNISSLEFGMDGEKVVLAYITEQDTDSETTGNDVYLWDGVQNIKKASGNNASVTYTELPGVTGKVMAFNNAGALQYINGNTVSEILPENTMNLGSGFYSTGNKVYYVRSGENARNLYVSAYEGGNWGQAPITNDEGYVDFFSGGNGKIFYLLNDATSLGDGTFDLVSDIKVLLADDQTDAELEDVDYVVDEAYPGATLPVELYIKNSGTTRITKAHVEVDYGEDVINPVDIDVDIIPGETKSYSYSFEIPASMYYGGDFSVVVSAEGDENSDNDSQVISLLKADLEVSASYDDSGEVPVINVLVENKGNRASNMELTITDAEGKQLYTESGKVEAEGSLPFTKEYTDTTYQVLTIEAVSDTKEFYTDNNVVTLTVGKDSGTPDPGPGPDPGPDPDPDPDPDPVVEEEFSVRFSETVSDPYEGLFLNKDYGTDGRYEVVYTGEAIKPSVVVTGYKGQKLVEGVDYAVKYSNNVKASANGKAATVTVSGKGNYAGKLKEPLKFTILQADLGVLKERGRLDAPEEIKIQSGKKASPVLVYDSYTLKASDMIISNTKAIKEDTTISVNGKGNFTGEIKNISVKVLDAAAVKASSIKVTLKAGKHYYDGTEQVLSWSTESTPGELTVTAGSSKVPLVIDDDYVVIYRPGTNVNAGTAKFTVKGIGDYTGTVNKTFKILPDKTVNVTTELTDKDEAITYSSAGATPSFTVKAIRPGQEPVVLTEGVDYKITYSNNKKVSTAKSQGKYTVAFLGNYKGHKAVSGTFAITPASFADAGAEAADKLYTKPGKYLSVPFVTMNGELLKSKDYTVKYYNTEGGTEKELTSKDKLTLADGEAFREITVKITGKGNYKEETVSATYKVIRASAEQINLSKARIVAEKKNDKGKDVSVGKQEYTGDEISPAIRVQIKDGKIWKDVDPSCYTVTYLGNVKKGTATILVTGDNDKAVGSVTSKFTIGTRNFASFILRLLGK